MTGPFLVMAGTEFSLWRLIRSGPLPGAMNMALDDALLQAVAAGASPPVLRFYRWQPAALSLGYAQKVDAAVDLDACHQAGVDVVRRPTGGRAVLHDHEVTYALMTPCTPPFSLSVAHNYRLIAEILGEALRHFGLAAELVPGKSQPRQGQAVCFTAPAQHELLVAGCKVAGCAQKRRGGSFLQHGSIPLEMDLELLRRLLPERRGESPEARLRGVGWLNRFAAKPLTVDEVETELIACFSRTLGVKMHESLPFSREVAAAEELCRRFYADPLWTRQGPGSVADPSPSGVTT